MERVVSQSTGTGGGFAASSDDDRWLELDSESIGH
jgi:hypothetical protein